MKICMRCGYREHDMKADYCLDCGGSLERVLVIKAPPALPPLSRAVDTTPSAGYPIGGEVIGWVKEAPFRATSLLCALLLGCFILPFVSVSCAGEKVAVRGVELALGLDVQGEKLDVVLSASIALLLAFLTLCFSRGALKDTKYGIGVVLCATACLVALLMIPGEIMRQAGGGPTASINHELGLNGAMVLCVVIAVVGSIGIADLSKLPVIKVQRRE